MSAYLGFASDLKGLLARMRPRAEEYADDFKAAQAVVPGLEAKVRDQLAAEHLVHCFRMEYGDGYVAVLPQTSPTDRGTGTAKQQGNKTDVLLRELGVTSGDVRAWAISTGLLATITRGRIGYDIVELYALAHEEKTA